MLCGDVWAQRAQRLSICKWLPRASDRAARPLVAIEGKGARLGPSLASGHALAALLRKPVMTARRVADSLHVTPKTETSNLRALSGASLVREVTGREWFRAFSLKI